MAHARKQVRGKQLVAKVMAATIAEIMEFVPVERLFPCTNCGMAPMRRDIALAKLMALGQGAALARRRLRA